ncbi:MAG TPA: hypothetical protein VK808_04510 [Bacteroidia bacterium]|jgi:hypothetical protein|nr:hypothetical protein [Bacteroidia bacterium]
MNKKTQQRILFITQWPFEDPLVQTYTLPYVRIIQKITSCYPYVVTINKNDNSIIVKRKGGVISIQIPSGKRLLFCGWLLNILTLRKIIRKKSIKILHPWCTTAGAVGAILKILDKRLKLHIDSFEPHAEAMVENKTWRKSGLKYNVLFYFEKLESRIADHLIFAAPGMENYIQNKYKTKVVNYSVKPACIDLRDFSISKVKNPELVNKYNLQDKIVCVYAGKFGGIYLEDETFQFIKCCENYWGKDKFRFLLLSNTCEDYIKDKSIKFDIEPFITIKLFVPHKDVPQYMGLADFAISPVKPVPTKKYCTPIKDGEYWALGLPVVIPPNISVDSDIIRENRAGAILESFDEVGELKAIEEIDSIIKGKSREDVYNKIRPLAEKYRNFNIAEEVYREIYQ